jgi:dolichol-phosphate mannosyltransferase
LKKIKVSIIIPALNEVENLKALLPQIKNIITKNYLKVDTEIFVIDGIKISNKVLNLCKELEINYINRQPRNDFGDAIRSGIQNAKKPDWLIIMDSDGSHNPETLIKFYEEIIKNEFDLVISSRYVSGGKTENNFILVLMSLIVNIIYRFLFKIKVKDVSNNFRLYKFEYLEKINLEEKNFEIVEEILIKLNKNFQYLKILEIPDTFKKRKFGKSKRDLIKFSISFLNSIIKLYRYKF